MVPSVKHQTYLRPEGLSFLLNERKGSLVPIVSSILLWAYVLINCESPKKKETMLDGRKHERFQNLFFLSTSWRGQAFFFLFLILKASPTLRKKKRSPGAHVVSTAFNTSSGNEASYSFLSLQRGLSFIQKKFESVRGHRPQPG